MMSQNMKLYKVRKRLQQLNSLYSNKNSQFCALVTGLPFDRVPNQEPRVISLYL